MSWQSPLTGAQHIDYRGRRFVLGRTEDGYAIWDTESGGPPVQTYDRTPEGWAAAWQTYEAWEGPTARTQQTAVGIEVSPTAGWRRGQPLALGPMRVGQLLDGAFKLYRMEFRTLVPLVAFVIVPLEVLVLVLELATLEPRLVVTGFQRVIVEEPALWVTLGAALLQLLFVGPFLAAAVLRTAGDAYLGRRPSVRSAYRAALPRVHSILWITLLMFVTLFLIFAPAIGLLIVGEYVAEGATGFGVILMLVSFVPAGFVFLRWLFAAPTIVLEDVRGIAALRRSWRLATGLTGKILGTMLLTWLILFALLFVVGVIFGLFVGLAYSEGFATAAGPGPGFYAINHAINALVTILITPFPTLVAVLLYFDARIRKEGFDLEVMAQQLGGPPPSGA